MSKYPPEKCRTVRPLFPDNLGPGCKTPVVDRQRTALPGDDVFRFVETVTPEVTERPQCFAFVKRPHPLGGIFHHRQTMFPGLIVDEKIALIDPVEVSFMAEFLFKIKSVIGDRKIDYLVLRMRPQPELLTVCILIVSLKLQSTGQAVVEGRSEDRSHAGRQRLDIWS